jgi:hypothetical protein
MIDPEVRSSSVSDLFPLRLQSRLDQAADGFGSIQLPSLTCDPFVDALHFVFGPLRVWACSECPLCHPFSDRDRRGDFSTTCFPSSDLCLLRRLIPRVLRQDMQSRLYIMARIAAWRGREALNSLQFTLCFDDLIIGKPGHGVNAEPAI